MTKQVKIIMTHCINYEEFHAELLRHIMSYVKYSWIFMICKELSLKTGILNFISAS